MEDETIEFRIEKLEVEIEEVENENKILDNTIKGLNELKDKIPIREIEINVYNFIKDLENIKSNNEEIKEQIETDIEFVRGLENK